MKINFKFYDAPKAKFLHFSKWRGKWGPYKLIYLNFIVWRFWLRVEVRK